MVDVTVTMYGETSATLATGQWTACPRVGEYIRIITANGDIMLKVRDVMWLVSEGKRDRSQATVVVEASG